MTNADYTNMMAVLRRIEKGVEGVRLTKRECFAAMAMQGLITCQMYDAISYKAAMAEAVKNADALIDELNKEAK